jgi:nicotinic acid mononucleotide adenylyltransferase
MRWREIPAAARLLVLARSGWDEARLRRESPPEVLALVDGGEASLLVEPAVDLSSTLLRETLGRGEEPPTGALAPLVLDYVRKYSLYR